eukprot:CAMPEP_0198292598 /NCGR_PEP_ID=MMETSP1449-20131203/12925_1 /TAXON_ID=420275 /ORGANISM="Attheya septentrionalis, Strain CCMP2084" /LENGTH=111 /DNA_ID=CAMNT_0043991789 /DNA_START=96 /DNA_END=431 /DNA_ORIENTATION=+
MPPGYFEANVVGFGLGKLFLVFQPAQLLGAYLQLLRESIAHLMVSLAFVHECRMAIAQEGLGPPWFPLRVIGRLKVKAPEVGIGLQISRQLEYIPQNRLTPKPRKVGHCQV